MAIGCPGGLGSWLWVCALGWWDNQKVDTPPQSRWHVVVAVALCVMALGCREPGCGDPLWKAVLPWHRGWETVVATFCVGLRERVGHSAVANGMWLSQHSGSQNVAAPCCGW